MSLGHFEFTSKYLRGSTEVNIILPDLPQDADPESYYTEGKKYPVLWLLHGGMGSCSDWVRRSNIELYATENELIVVMPSALNSSYCNWPNFGGGYLAHDYIIHELMPMVYAWFPASRKRGDNYMAGLSMGGHGTWKFAVNYPEKFAACAMLSAPAPDFQARYEAEQRSGKPGHTSDLINAYGGLDAFLASRENTRGVAKMLAERGETAKLPRIFASVGTEDPHYEEIAGTVAYFRSLGFPIEFREVPGYAHEWRFWELAVQDALAFFGFRIGK